MKFQNASHGNYISEMYKTVIEIKEEIEIKKENKKRKIYIYISVCLSVCVYSALGGERETFYLLVVVCLSARQ